MDYTFYNVFLIFVIYSIIGYLIEVFVCSIEYKKIVNRGFLFGPWCPVYGLGSILILITLLRYESDPIVVFVFGVIITSCVEYYTSYILEKIFHNKWWDYSHRPDSINGRICVGNMVAFGVGSCAIIYVTQPIINMFLGIFKREILKIIFIIILIIFIADVIYSCIIAYTLRNRIIVAEELKREKLLMIPTILEKKLKNIRIKTIRYFKVFPNLKSKYSKELDQIRKWLENNSNKIKRKKKIHK